MVSGGATDNTFGGTVAGARNVISGNFSYGMLVKDPGTSGNVVEGNYVGLDANGADGGAGVHSGRDQSYNGATNNLIGGTVAGAANFVSGFYLWRLHHRCRHQRQFCRGQFHRHRLHRHERGLAIL